MTALASDDLKTALVRFDEECAAYLEHVQSGYVLARKDLEARIAAAELEEAQPEAAQPA